MLLGHLVYTHCAVLFFLCNPIICPSEESSEDEFTAYIPKQYLVEIVSTLLEGVGLNLSLKYNFLSWFNTDLGYAVRMACL